MYLVDTNVLSELTRVRPHASVESFLSRQQLVNVSSISVMELEYGISRLAQGEKRERLTRWFEQVLASRAVQIVSIDTAIARATGRLKGLAESSGRSRPLADLIIAACAQVTGSVIATRNTSDFDGLGVPILNPFV